MEFVFSNAVKDLSGSATREIFRLLKAGDIISFAGGLPANECLPVKEVQEIAANVLEKGGLSILQYGTTEGNEELRTQLIDYSAQMGIPNMALENMQIVNGGQEGISLLLSALINPFDVVLVEDPTYLAVLQIIKSLQGKAIGVRANQDGLDLADLEEKIKKHKPKVLYVVPTFSNPTGKTYSEENRKSIARLTARYGVVVLEDDPYSKLRFEGEAKKPLKAFDEAGNVVFVSSFSKIISPGLRMGFAAGHKDLIRKMSVLKQGTTLHTSNLTQAILSAFLQGGRIESIMERAKPVYKKRRDAMICALAEKMPEEYWHTIPDGGLFIWGGFKGKAEKLNTDLLFKSAVDRKVAFVQGSNFFADGGGKNTLRLNFSNASNEQIEEGIGRLATLCKEEICKL